MSAPQYNYGGRGSAIPPFVKTLLIANGIGFLLGNAVPQLVGWFELWPLGMPERAYFSFMPWQLVSYGFLHVNATHLLFNMFAVWMFGSQLERLWGSKPFMFYYFVCVIGAGIIQAFVAPKGVPTIGASGGVFGLLLGYGMMYPNRMIMLIFPPIPMKAKYFVVGYGLLELWMGFTARQPSIAHFAHLGGMLFGFIMIMYWRGNLPFKPKRRLSR